MSTAILRRVRPDDLRVLRRRAVDAESLAAASQIVEDVRERGEVAVREHAERFGDVQPGDPLVIQGAQLADAALAIAPDKVELLQRARARIERFARAQKACLTDLDIAVDGGRAGHRWIPAATVGAYAPGGRYPLPSSVLMTVLPARIAGVGTVWVASPKPAPITLAAAAVCGADGVLAVGGAQAIAALAFGTFCDPSDLVVGPGNKFVTAAKKLLVGEIGIDALAGPSELVVIADAEADPTLIAADLLGQSEHDVDAAPILVTTCPELAAAVDVELQRQLQDLPTAGTASQALERNGLCVLVHSLDEAALVSDRLTPEHLELHVRDSASLANKVRAYGGLFIGAQSAEVFGDYGVGPNHVLPTGGSARFQAGLSVATFLRASTFLEVDCSSDIAKDTADFARLEGLEAHARAADCRR